MNKRLSLSNYLAIGSMLFGLFFGAGNLIFPVFMGQEAGRNLMPASLGLLVTAVGLPLLGVIAIGMTQSSGLFELASNVNRPFAYFITVALHLTIGPLFAIPRLSTTSFEIGLSKFIDPSQGKLALAIFTIIFYSIVLYFSLKPNKIVNVVGKVLTPIFLVAIGLLLVAACIRPMGNISTVQPNGSYINKPFFSGFIEGYNTMDAIASLAFGVIIVNSIKGYGVTKPKQISRDVMISGLFSMTLMAIIYVALTYIGTLSTNVYGASGNGGIILANLANHYFGSAGNILLFIAVTIACLKTGIGLVTAISETFVEIFPNSISYRSYAIVFSVLSTLIANFGLNKIIQLSLPVLMLLYPLTISIILLGILSPLYKNHQIVYKTTILFTIPASILDFLNASPAFIKELPLISNILKGLNNAIPLFDLGISWVLPSTVGFTLGLIFYFKNKSQKATDRKLEKI